MQVTPVRALHILVVGPFVVFVGHAKPNQRWPYIVLLCAAAALVGVFAVHAKRDGRINPWLAVHATLFAALFTYVGVRRRDAAPVAFSFLVAVGLAAIAYNVYRSV
jgi:uncharacterized membrane protein YfcA